MWALARRDSRAGNDAPAARARFVSDMSAAAADSAPSSCDWSQRRLPIALDISLLPSSIAQAGVMSHCCSIPPSRAQARQLSRLYIANVLWVTEFNTCSLPLSCFESAAVAHSLNQSFSIGCEFCAVFPGVWALSAGGGALRGGGAFLPCEAWGNEETGRRVSVRGVCHT